MPAKGGLTKMSGPEGGIGRVKRGAEIGLEAVSEQ